MPSPSPLFQAVGVPNSVVILKTLWTSCEAYWGFTPLDKGHTHQFLQNKSFSATTSETTETVPLSFLEAFKVLYVPTLALSEVLKKNFIAILSFVFLLFSYDRALHLSFAKELSPNFGITCCLERVAIFKPTIPGFFLSESFSFRLLISSCILL